MADLKPIGSEKLQGIDKIRRMIEISNYNTTYSPNNDVIQENDGTTEYKIKLADGFYYGIVKETKGYILKSSVDSKNWSYIKNITERKYYNSYSQALKRLNIIVSETSRNNDYDYEIPLIGEQSSPKKKFVLRNKGAKTKTPTDTAPATDAGTPPAGLPPTDTAGTPPTDTAGTPPTDTAGVPPTDVAGTPPTDAAPTNPNASPDNILLGGADAGTPPPTEDAGTPPMGGEDMDTGMPPMGGEDMDTGMPPMGGEDMGGNEPPTDDEGIEGDEESAAGPSGLKTIQKLTGRLSQKLRAFDKDKGMDSQDIKYVLNSIISAIDIAKLDEDDKEDILDKFDELDEYGEDEGLDLDLGDEEMPDEEMGMELPGETPPVESGTPPTLPESRVDRILSNYFTINENEKPVLNKKRKKDFLQKKLSLIKMKEEVENLSETRKQVLVSNRLISENQDIKFIGKTNKNNLIFTHNGKQIKITPNGRII